MERARSNDLLYPRRALLECAVGLGLTAWASPSAAQSAMAPPHLQASLLARVAGYDRNFAARAIDRAKVLLVARDGDAESARGVADIKSALESIVTIGGLPHTEEVLEYSDAQSLASTCTSHRISIVYFGTGFVDQIPVIRAALTFLDVLSVGATTDYVPPGMVLAFEPVSNKARCWVHLTQARLQNVKFASRLLKLANIFE
jgi:hypothetical protein